METSFLALSCKLSSQKVMAGNSMFDALWYEIEVKAGLNIYLMLLKSTVD